MLIDELEAKAAELARKREELQGLIRQYKQFYSGDIRAEMKSVRGSIAATRGEVLELVLENLQELRLIKSYYPELYGMLLEDEGIGRILKDKEWLIAKKPQAQDPGKALETLRQERRQLKEAREFVAKWPGREIDEKSMAATWPVLKGFLFPRMYKQDALEAIRKKEKELIAAGWAIIVDTPLMERQVRRFLEKLKKLRSVEEEKRREVETHKDKSVTKTYEAEKELAKARKAREGMERTCRRMLLSSPSLLERLKKTLRPGKKGENDLVKLVATIPLKRINEKEWLAEMGKKVG